VAALQEELQALMAALPGLDRHVLQLRLQGATVGEISRSVQRSERTVRRLLQRTRGVMESRLLGEW
jgi:DNA-directed RNA polymerase specialized sigma24 family protein